MRVIDTAAGSACSLVANLFCEQLHAAPPELLVLLLSTIAVDTRGLDAKELKYSAADVLAVQRLLSALDGREVPLLPDGAGSEQVLEQAETLRVSSLPPAAAIGGAATVAELGSKLLEARYDVASLSAFDLLRLDYKQATSAESVVGVSAIFCPMVELIQRAGGRDSLAEAMVAFGKSNRVDLMLTISATDDAQGLKGVSLLPVHPGAAAAADALAAALAAIPTGLSAGLASQPLFVKQCIPTNGFGVEFGSLASGLRISDLRKEITRKTLLPCVLECCAAIQKSTSAISSGGCSAL